MALMKSASALTAAVNITIVDSEGLNFGFKLALTSALVLLSQPN